MEDEDAEKTAKEAEEKFSRFKDPTLIFGNNFMHCLVMFTPILGPVYAVFVFYSTGRVIAALATATMTWLNPLGLFALLFLFPHTWIEYIAYALALSQSVWLIIEAFRRRLRNELINTCIFVTVCALALFLAAVIEYMLIQSTVI